MTAVELKSNTMQIMRKDHSQFLYFFEVQNCLKLVQIIKLVQIYSYCTCT